MPLSFKPSLIPSLRSLARAWARGLLGLVLFLPLVRPNVVTAQTPSPEETRAFQRAMDAFTDGYYERAERSFAQFALTFTNSSLLTEAILLQAQSALNQTNASRAIGIVTAAMPKAGLLQDQYRFCLGNAYLESGNLAAAAETFAAITRTMTNSSLLLEASYGEAQARFRLGDYGAVVELLRRPEGPFDRAARTRASDKVTIRGRMLLAEAQFRLRQFGPAAATLNSIPDEHLLPEVRWERQYLLGRLLLAEGRSTEALAATTNLLSLAIATGNRVSLADSYFIQAGILRQLGRWEEAASAYTNNLADTAPPDHQRLSLLNLIELQLAQDRTTEAAAMLDNFLVRHPEDAAAGVVVLTRGELELKRYLLSATGAPGLVPAEPPPAPAEGGTPPVPGLLASALAKFEALLATNVTGPLRGKALLNKGWALWLEGRVPESASAFAGALTTLPFSEDQAVARFKLADAAFALKDYTNAIAHYRALTNDFASLPAVRSGLFEHGLFQTLRACVALGDERGATQTLRALLEMFPQSPRAARGLFLAGQELLAHARPHQGREHFEEFVRRFPNSPLRPEVELATARTYVEERKWPAALAAYSAWRERYPTNALRARAAFDYAHTLALAGQKTNALMQMTNFVLEFQSDGQLAPLAQFWVAEYQLGLGLHREAIGSFQKILENTNWPISTLTYQARFMAGLSAFAAQLWKDAAGEKGHFTILISDDNCPPDIAAQAWFALGDTLLNWDTPQTRPIDKYREAKEAFSRIPVRYTNSPIVPAAWGKVGDCHLQMASQDPKQYAEATNAYLRVITNATAEIGVRSQAEFGLARALELYGATLSPAEFAGFQKAAFDHYYNLLIGENLRDGEFTDPFWVEKAGTEAARIAESQKQWALAISIYQRMQKVLDPLRPRLEERIRRVQELVRRELR